MSVFDKIKEKQIEEETEKLEAVVRAKLESLWLELDLLKRTVRLTDDDATRLILGEYYVYATQLAVDEGNTKAEFIEMMSEVFDGILEEMAEAGDLEEEAGSDKESTDGGPGPVAVS